jgi:hypothetical protein
LDAGLLGFVGFTGVFVLGVAAAWRARRRRIAMPLPLGLVAAFGAVLLHSLVDGIFWGFKTQWALWFLFGIAFALDQISSQAAPEG